MTHARLAAGIVCLLGIVLVAAGAAGVWVGVKAERVVDLVRPEMSDEGLAQHRDDFETVSVLVTGLETRVLVAVATGLGLSNEQLRAEIERSLPAVAIVLAERESIEALAERSLLNLERQQEDFEEADSFPVAALPAYSGSIVDAVLGLAMIVSGAALFAGARLPRRMTIGAVVAIGVVLVVVPMALRIPQKAQSAERVLDSLNPSPDVVRRTEASLRIAEEGQAELETGLLPSLTSTLGIGRNGFLAALAQQLSKEAELILKMPWVLQRYETRVAIRSAGAEDIRTLKNLPIGALGWFDPAIGAVLIAAGVWSALAVRRRGISEDPTEATPT